MKQWLNSFFQNSQLDCSLRISKFQSYIFKNSRFLFSQTEHNSRHFKIRTVYSPNGPFKIQSTLRALKSTPYNCVLVICRALKSLNENASRVNSNSLQNIFLFFYQCYHFFNNTEVGDLISFIIQNSCACFLHDRFFYYYYYASFPTKKNLRPKKKKKKKVNF